MPPLPASPPQTARERGERRSRFDWVPRMPRVAPPPTPPPAYCAGRGENFRWGSMGCRCMPPEPPPPGPGPPLRRGGGDLNRAPAGLAHTTARAVREGGLWAFVAATLVAPAEPGPLLCGRCRAPNPRSVPPLPRCLWERVDEPRRGRVRAPRQPRPSASVTAAAPWLVRAPGWLLRPAAGVLRASSVRLGPLDDNSRFEPSNRARHQIFVRQTCDMRTRLP